MSAGCYLAHRPNPSSAVVKGRVRFKFRGLESQVVNVVLSQLVSVEETVVEEGLEDFGVCEALVALVMKVRSLKSLCSRQPPDRQPIHRGHSILCQGVKGCKYATPPNHPFFSTKIYSLVAVMHCP